MSENVIRNIQLLMDAPWSGGLVYDVSIDQVSEYLKRKTKIADRADYWTTDWDRVDICLYELDEAKTAGDIEKIASCAFGLGMAVQQLTLPYADEFLEAFEANVNRAKGLAKRNSKRNYFNTLVEYYAGWAWIEDLASKQLTIADVCKSVYSNLVDLLHSQDTSEDSKFTKSVISELMPDDAKGLRATVKKVAPAYASKPGRRKAKN